jgi:RNA polymerase sigma-54 factor
MVRGLFLKLSPERRLIMTFALRQSLEILQMNQLELGQWLHNEIVKNPLLEFNSSSNKKRFDFDVAAPLNLYEYLQNQIRENFPCPKEQLMALICLENLDENGFLSTEAMVQKPTEHILQILQTFDPPGIFARDLKEAFLIQLRVKGKSESLAFQLVQNCFDDLLHGRYTAIKKKLYCTRPKSVKNAKEAPCNLSQAKPVPKQLNLKSLAMQADLKFSGCPTPADSHFLGGCSIGDSDLNEAIRDLSRLSFRPASGFKQEPIACIHPDIHIARVEKGWTLELVEEDLPKFHIQEEYMDLYPDTREEQQTLRTFKTEAKWIFRSLNRRRKLLREIGRFLLCKQAAYLDQKGPLNLLTMRDIAEKLEIHESTLSRALAGKYASTPRGIIPLRSLISSAPATDTAREILEKLISNEDKRKPLTDEQLASELKQKGFPVARRTISKYRSQLKIGSATQRKHRS